MKTLLLFGLLCCGCASYTAAKIGLVDQVRRGIDVTRRATVARQQLIERLGAAQVDRLDEAFDTDVRHRPLLDANWVITHRKAYSAARDTLNEERYALRREQETIESNLDLIEKALAQLQLMHHAEARITIPEVMK